MSHSPEPWTWKSSMNMDGSDPHGCIDRQGGFLDADGKQICWFGDTEGYYPTAGDEPTQADIDRIIACVNACRGIPTESLRRCEIHTDECRLVGDQEGWCTCRETAK